MDEQPAPRKEIWDKIKEEDFDFLLDEAAKLHGHYCPGLALGVKAACTAVNEMDIEHEGMEDVLAVVDTNNCLSDGIQYVTGCTFGNNSLIFRDLGKTAVTLTMRDEKGIRLQAKPDAGENWNDEFPRYGELFDKIVSEREGTEEKEKEFQRLGKKVSHHVVNIPAEKLFDISEKSIDIPDYAPIHGSFTCDLCGESVMASRKVEEDGKELCLECSSEGYNELTGFGIHLNEGRN